MSSLFRFRTIACVTLLTLPACVARLTDRNSPEENGGVTGEPANCSAITVLPHGAPGGEAAPKFVGRFAYPEAGEALFDWSGNYITVRFQGTSKLTVKLQTQGPMQDQLFTFVVDDLPPSTREITVKKDAAGNPTQELEENYDIVGLDPNKPHEVTIHKNTEPQKGWVTFHGFDLNGGTLLPPTRRPRRMEFIGDSIVCGYGNEGKNATCPFEVKVREVEDNGRMVPVTVPVTENQYLAFTAIAARELDADAVTTCWSGKGVSRNYKERYKADPNDPTKFLYQCFDDPERTKPRECSPEERTPENRVLAEDARDPMPAFWEKRTVASELDKYPWDFTQEKPEEIPQVVFISLGTNDFSRDTFPPAPDPTKLEGDNVPDGDLRKPEAREEFFQKYLELVNKVREHRPDAHIFLATPPMVTNQFPLDNARQYIQDTLHRIVAEREAKGDRKVYAMNLVEQGFRYGLGCDYHPNLEVHRIMAKQLVGAVRSKTCW